MRFLAVLLLVLLSPSLSVAGEIKNCTVEVLDKIPNEFWVVLSGIGGGVLTLLVTYIQGRSEKGKLAAQLSHDMQVRRESREMSMRREIYYDAISSLALAINTLSRLAEVDLNNHSISNADISSKFQKIQLVADKELLKAFNDCMNLISQSFVELLPLKLDLQKLEVEKDLENKLHLMASEQVQKTILKMEELNKENISDKNRWKIVNEAYTKYSVEVQIHINKGIELNKVIFSRKIELLKQSAGRLTPVNKSASGVLIAMRKELDNSVENETVAFLDKLIGEANEKNAHLFEKLIRDVQAAVNIPVNISLENKKDA